MYLQYYVILIIYGLSQNFVSTQDFFQAQLSPSTLTSVPYLDGEVAVYEHKQSRSRLFVPPLAVLYLNETRVFYNTLSKKYLLRLSLILYTNELRTTVLQYLSNTRDRCSASKEICDVKMVPTERLRVVWRRADDLSADYKLDTSWQSNTALRNKIDAHFECVTNQTCYKLLKDILATPDILDGLELEYSTQTEKQTRKEVTITGQHLMKTKMYSELKQLPSSIVDTSLRYLLVDDMNQLITEILTTMEIEEITDSDYIPHDEQKILAELLKQRLSLNVETLHGHMERQWDSVYWNSDNIRPDRIVHLLNDELKVSQNKTNLKNLNGSFIQQENYDKHVHKNGSHDSFDNSENEASSVHNKTDRFKDYAGSSSTSQTVIDQHSSDQSQSNAFGQSQSRSSHRDRSSQHEVSVGGGTSNVNVQGSQSRSNTKIDTRSNARSNYGVNEWRNAFSKYNDYSRSASHAWKDTEATGDDLSLYNENAWRRAAVQNRKSAVDDTIAENDVESFQELRQKNYDFYTNNHQYIEFTGEKFIVKPVKAYKLNLATFQENTKFIHKRITVSNIDLIHAVPLRILSLSSNTVLTTVPVTDNYTNVFESKLNNYTNMFESKLHDYANLLESKLNDLNKKLTISELAATHVTTTIQNNVETLRTNTNKQLTELQLSDITIKNNAENLRLHTIHSSPLVGEIRLYSSGTPSPPCPWIFCHGQALSRVDYQQLFSVIDESFGAGDGKTTFNVPDFRDRFPLGLNPINSSVDGWAKGGDKEQTLTIGHMPPHDHDAGTLCTNSAGSHTHTVDDPGHNHGGHTQDGDPFISHVTAIGHAVNGYTYLVYNHGHHKTHRHVIALGKTGISLNNDGTHSHSIQGSTGSVGNGNSFSIMPPYQTIAYIIFTGANCT